jgi:glutamate racemase
MAHRFLIKSDEKPCCAEEPSQEKGDPVLLRFQSRSMESIQVPVSAMSQQQPQIDRVLQGGGDSNSPVGVFDSGVGGLTILSELLRELPDERYVYFGDTGNCPYGVRPREEIQLLAENAARLLLSHHAKLIVVACNAASVSAISDLRVKFPFIEFVGVVPAVKPAAQLSRTGKVGVASTEASARSDFLRQLIEEHAGGVEVLAVGCPRLVTMVEAGRLGGPDVESVIREYIQPMLDAGIDTLVLGCTHFPAIRNAFQRVVGPQVTVIDSGDAIARRTRYLLTKLELLAAPDGEPFTRPRAPSSQDEFWCSGAAEDFSHVAGAILNSPIRACQAEGMLMQPSEAAGV